MLVGGEPDPVARALPVLDLLAQRVVHCGPVGSGVAMRALNSLLTAIDFAATIETMQIGRRYGLDPELMLDVFNGSTGTNHATAEEIAPFVLTGRFNSGLSLEQLVREATAALGVARTTKTDVPLCRTAGELWRMAEAGLEPGADHTALARWYEHRSGTRLGRSEYGEASLPMPHRYFGFGDGQAAGRMFMFMRSRFFGVDLGLDPGEAVVAGAEGALDPAGLVLGHEVDVDTAGGEPGGPVEELARPGDAVRVLGRVLPAGVHVHEEAGAALGEGGRVRVDPLGGAAELGDEHLAFTGRQPADALGQEVDQAVVDRIEIVRLPVVAGTRREQRVEGLLPAGERVRADDVGDRLAQRAERRQRLLAFRHVAGVAGGEDQDLAAVPFLGQERQGRRLAHHDPDGELVRHGGGEAAILAQQLRGRVERMDDEAGEDLRADLVQLEVEASDDAEIAAAAADRPEEVRVLTGRWRGGSGRRG